LQKLRAVKTVRFYKRCFYQKIVKFDTAGGRLKVFFEDTKPDGFLYVRKIACCKNVPFLQKVFFDNFPQIGEVIKKVFKPTPCGVGLKCFLKINPIGVYLQKIDLKYK
jgi:hypothetical protein